MASLGELTVSIKPTWSLLFKLFSREFLTTILVIAAVVILALNDKLTTELMTALLGTNGIYVWSRTRVKQTNGERLKGEVNDNMS